MPGFVHKRLLFIFLFVTAIISGWISMDKMSSKEGWRTGIFMDGRGYYTYLPAFFIYNDPSCSFYKTASSYPGDTANFINIIDGKPVNKYYCGVAALQLPFFATAHLVAKAGGYPPNGYTQPYQYAVALAGLFYFLAGLYFLWKLLEKFGFRNYVILTVCICFAFGTNLFHYAVYEPSMSHVYSFAAISAFLFFTRSFLLAPSGKLLLAMTIAFGLVTILRPINTMIILALPAMAGSRENFKIAFQWIGQHKLKLLTACLLYFSICFIQLGLYKWQTGHLIVWSYKNEGFDFLHPHIFGTLLSYDKGLFVYTPLILLSLAGMLVILRRSWFLFAGLLLVLFVIVYVVSSWHDWRYGYSFGLRAYVEYYTLFALSFAFLVDFVLTGKRRALSAGLLTGLVVSACLVVYGIQQYQATHRILHSGFMNKARYWKIFLKTDKKYENLLYQEGFVLESDGNFNDMEGSEDWPGLETIVKGPAYSGSHASRIDSLLPYSVGFCRRMENDDERRIKISAWVMRENREDSGEMIIAAAAKDSGVFSTKVPLPPFEAGGKWQLLQSEIVLPKSIAEDEYLRVFFIRYNGVIYIDDFSVEGFD